MELPNLAYQRTREVFESFRPDKARLCVSSGAIRPSRIFVFCREECWQNRRLQLQLKGILVREEDGYDNRRSSSELFEAHLRPQT